MPVTIRLWDAAIPGTRTEAGAITLTDSRITVRELIRSRVRQEVERYNQALPEVFEGMVQPEQSERILNGYRMAARRRLDPEAQCHRACASFDSNGFLLLVDGAQVTELDHWLDLRPGSEIEFVKLVPLIGG
ncbi:MAG: hypothetical protein SFV51_18375 [Bryobacteraceae bacterium]|nr:hypothetical protein [Bryobacteraceae bacterium]